MSNDGLNRVPPRPEIVQYVVLNNPRLTGRRRRIPRPADIPRDTVRKRRGHGRIITVLNRVERRLGAATKRGIHQNDIRGAAFFDKAGIQFIDIRVIAGCRRDHHFRRMFRQARHLDHRLDHPERHHTGSGRRIGRVNHPCPGNILAQEFLAYQQTGA